MRKAAALPLSARMASLQSDNARSEIIFRPPPPAPVAERGCAILCGHLGIIDHAVACRDTFIGLAEHSDELATIKIALAVGHRRTQEEQTRQPRRQGAPKNAYSLQLLPSRPTVQRGPTSYVGRPLSRNILEAEDRRAGMRSDRTRRFRGKWSHSSNSIGFADAFVVSRQCHGSRTKRKFGLTSRHFAFAWIGLSHIFRRHTNRAARRQWIALIRSIDQTSRKLRRSAQTLRPDIRISKSVERWLFGNFRPAKYFVKQWLKRVLGEAGRVCKFATPVRKRTVTKIHKASLNCLLVREQQLFVQDLGMLIRRVGGRFAGETWGVESLGQSRFTGLLRGTHEI